MMSKGNKSEFGDAETVYEDAAAEIEVRSGIPKPREKAINWNEYNSPRLGPSTLRDSSRGVSTDKVPVRHGVPDRRQAMRVKDKLKVVLSLVFPAETFTPFFEETCVFNISASGGMAQVTAPSHVIDKLLKEPHYCRLQFSGDGLPSRVLGKVIWVLPTAGSKATHRIGLRFDHATEDDSAKLEDYLKHELRRQSAQITSSSSEWAASQRIDGGRFRLMDRE